MERPALCRGTSTGVRFPGGLRLMIQTDRDCPSAGDQVSRNPIILMSSRGPIEFSTGEDGRLIQRRADGGVATVLGAVANTTDTTWLAGARSEADRIAAA